ncbi:hypothetical protein GQ44DRAFT_796855 [Phaeosphaeriaceae sp. PMI808]|nr:hypothetical protein GQ44DRAFT_796855 [Phaeosphaeriaceae sp. PMI808]
MPVIKREDSPESPIPSIEFTAPSEITRPKPLLPPPKPSTLSKKSHLTRDRYHGSSPNKYRLAALGNHAISRKKIRSPTFSRFPFRLGSAATRRVNKRAALTEPSSITRPHNNQNTIRNRSPGRHLKSIDRKGKNMDNNEFFFSAAPDDFLFPSMMTTNEEDGLTVTISRTEFEALQDEVRDLLHSQAATEERVEDQDGLIDQLVNSNRQIYSMLEDANARMSRLETNKMSTFGNASMAAPAIGSTIEYRGIADGRSRSPSPHSQDYRARDEPINTKRGRKNLAISLPGKMYIPPGAELPTPMTALTGTFSSKAPKAPKTPKTPRTPGRAGPPSGCKKAVTSVSKRLRGMHNLDKTIPPTFAQLPSIPLTDTELIVFFFNSLSRPIVALRLYGRGWGPATICDVLNSHRVIEPEYLRNTCSVKCITALKKGREQYGEEWEKDVRSAFEDLVGTTDVEATEMIQLTPDELPRKVDFEMQDLCVDLRRFPDEENGGIFTQCVKHCQEKNFACKVSEAGKLAEDLEAGRTPVGTHTFQNNEGAVDSHDSAGNDF